MTTEERLTQFREFLACRLELYPCFMSKNCDPWSKNDFITNFTFENWLLGGKAKASYGYFNISKRTLKTPLKKISSDSFHSTHYGTQKPDDGVEFYEGFEYSVFRGVTYNFKRKLYKRTKDGMQAM